MAYSLLQTLQTIQQRRIKGTYHTIQRGSTPNVGINLSDSFFRGIGLGLVVGFISTIIALITFYLLDTPNWCKDGIVAGGIIAITVSVIYYIAPLVFFPLILVLTRGWPRRSWLASFTVGQKFISACVLSIGIIYLVSHYGPHWDIWLKFQYTGWRHNLVYGVFFHSLLLGLVIMLIISAILCLLIPLFFPKGSRIGPASLKSSLSRLSHYRHHPFGLWLGSSTGVLANAWHVANMRANQEVTLSLEEAAMNILVLGGTGSGKTTRVMQPLLAQLLAQDCGGLLFDVKTDVQNTAMKLSEIAHREITVIGPGRTRMNLLAGLTPETASSFIKSVLLMGSARISDPFWIDTATELCRNTLGVLQFLPEFYSLQGLYQYIFNEDFRREVKELLEPKLSTLPDQERRVLQSYQNYYTDIYLKSNEKTQNDVNTTLAKALSPFNHPDLMDAFCTTQGLQEDALNMQSVLEGTIYLVDLPLSDWGLGAKVAYMLIKLRFFNVMQSRNTHEDWNQDRPVFFMCDEYQELIAANKDGLSDLNFWDKSRSSKTIGIVSSQSVKSFYAALGDRDTADTILNNFRQKLCFRNEDKATLDYLNTITGQAKVIKKTTSRTKGKSIASVLSKGRDSSHNSETQTVTESRELVIDAALVRQLQPQQIVALLSVNNQSADDVLNTVPVYAVKT